MKRNFDYSEDQPPNVPEAKGHPHHRARLCNFVGLVRKLQDSIDADKASLGKLVLCAARAILLCCKNGTD
jgi:hypothetical protein